MAIYRYSGNQTGQVIAAPSGFSGTQGQISFNYTPQFDYATKGLRYCVLDIGHDDTAQDRRVQLHWDSDPAPWVEGALLFMHDSNWQAYAYPRINTGVERRITLRWGDPLYPTAPVLRSGILVGNEEPTIWNDVAGSFTAGPTIGIGVAIQDDYAAGPFQGTITDVEIATTRDIGSRVICCFGNSIVRDQNQSAVTCWGKELGLLRPAWDIQVSGISNTLDYHIARFAADVVTQRPHTCVIHAGINDVSLDVDAATVIARFEQLYGLCAAAGIVCVGTTLMPWGNYAPRYTAGREAVRQTVNTWLRSSSAISAGADGIIDMDSLMWDPADHNVLLAAYDSGDGLHPGDLGHQGFANFVSAYLTLPQSTAAASEAVFADAATSTASFSDSVTA